MPVSVDSDFSSGLPMGKFSANPLFESGTEDAGSWIKAFVFSACHLQKSGVLIASQLTISIMTTAHVYLPERNKRSTLSIAS
jgi:hypothetical protein